jgi:tRNA nucleotidyltransferase (CCA-adding enzyme)
MHLVLCHTTADFDTLGAAVGVSCLRPGSRIVLTGGAHPTVEEFLSIWRDEYALIERRAVEFDQVQSLTLVDAHQRDRFAPVSDWIDQAEQRNLPIYIYDHHLAAEASHSVLASSALAPDMPTAEVYIEAVGAVTTLMVEQLQRQAIAPNPFEATVMALGIHSDTGSLTFEQATARDAAALAWLMAQGANQQVIAEKSEPSLSPRLQALLRVALATVEVEQVRWHHLGWVKLETESFVPGLSGLAERLIGLLGLDTLLLCATYPTAQTRKAVIIGRSRPNPLLPHRIDLRAVFEPLGGGGHAQAASVVLKASDFARDCADGDPDGDLQIPFEQALARVRSQIPPAITAKSLMSSPVRTILPSTTVDEAQRILLRYGHSGLCVVSAEGALVGIVSRRDIDIALRHGLGHGSVKGGMSVNIKSIEPDTPIAEIQSLMVTYDIGRLPVLKAGELVGIVTRTDLLRHLHQDQQTGQQTGQQPAYRSQGPSCQIAPVVSVDSQPLKFQPPRQAQSRPLNRPPAADTLYQQLRQQLRQQLKSRLPEIWPALMLIAAAAEQRGWALYVVGGAVRDLLLSLSDQPYPLTDIDLVVDGAEAGAGVTLAKALQADYPQVAVQVYGQFQTASLIWHSSDSSPLLIDIATARTEYYPYPAANPEVEASTIRQDLYRRDFTINAMALQLSDSRHGSGHGGHGFGHGFGHSSERGQLLDFFGGWRDLQQRHVRVLHANSFVEDPTRIFRAVRFAVRLGFTIDPQSEQFIRYAIGSGVYAQMQASQEKAPALQTRLKAELQYLLSVDQWATSLAEIDRLGALVCLHPDMTISADLWRQLRRMDRWLDKISDLKDTLPRWQMLLELMIAQLPTASCIQTATQLDLGAASLHRLQHLHQWEADLAEKLPKAHRPSQIYRLLNPYDWPALLLMSDRYPHTLGPAIWRYRMQLARMPALINGDTLKRLGYRPGPQFRHILSDVYQLTLDGDLSDPKAAEDYVLSHHRVM